MLGGNKKASIPSSSATTLISRDTRIVGDVHFTGTLDVEGTVVGNIIAEPETEALVRVVDKGRVEGDIRAPSVVINGSIQGNVTSTKHLELANKARVEGDVQYVLVEMAVGAEVNGSLQHQAVAEPAGRGAKNSKKSDTSASAVELSGAEAPAS